MDKIRYKLLLYILISCKLMAGGVEILNFYEEIPENNILKSYLEIEKTKEYDYQKWRIAQGNSLLGKDYKLDYEVIRKKDKVEYQSGNSKGWENEFALSKKFKEYQIFSKTWSNEIGVLWKYEQLDYPEQFGTDIARDKYSIRYRMRTNSDFGKGGTYWGVDFLGSIVENEKKDGESAEINIVGMTNLGYGFQTYTTLFNEYLNYGVSSGAYLMRVENITRWSYELSEHFLFSIEANTNLYEYFGDTDYEYSLKFNIAPYLQYSFEILENVRGFAKIGIGGYEYEDWKAKEYRSKKSGYYFNSYAGIQYVW